MGIPFFQSSKLKIGRCSAQFSVPTDLMFSAWSCSRTSSRAGEELLDMAGEEVVDMAGEELLDMAG